jgi:hypothetical protein
VKSPIAEVGGADDFKIQRLSMLRDTIILKEIRLLGESVSKNRVVLFTVSQP